MPPKHQKTPKTTPAPAAPAAAAAAPATSSVEPANQSAPLFLHRIQSWQWFVGLAAAQLVHLAVAPYSKVEESFHSQAAHDLIFHGPLALEHFDHVEFPGPVKRSFAGALLLWLATLPVSLPVLHLRSLGLYKLLMPQTKIAFQYIVRGVLALATAGSLTSVQAAVRSEHGIIAGAWFGVLSLVQFHLIFWGSRTLSNIFALVLFNYALAAWISSSREPAPQQGSSPLTRSFRRTIILLAFATVVFRAELAIPSAAMILSDILDYKRFPFVPTLQYCFFISVAAIITTMTIDSYFWDTPRTWPEFESFIFNVLENKSAEWGVSPYHTYFSTLIPRIAPLSYILSFFAWRFATLEIHRYWRIFFAYVGLYSILGHKEWRFVVYMVPLLNVTAAIGMSRIYEMASQPLSVKPDAAPAKTKSADKAESKQPSRHVLKPTTARIFIIVSCLVAIGSLAMSGAMLYVSSLNYPGGIAFSRLHSLIADRHPTAVSRGCSIHIDTFAAMSGVTRFGEHSDTFPFVCTYSKFENHTAASEFVDAGYTFLVTSTPSMHLDMSGRQHWDVVDTIQGFSHIDIMPLDEWAKQSIERALSGHVLQIRLPVFPVTSPQVYILAAKVSEK
eukprot:jgi/Hompol1/5907/HPOL_004753-RA